MRGGSLSRIVLVAIAALALPAAGQTPTGSLAERLKAVQNPSADKAAQAPAHRLPDWKPFPAGTQAPYVPLVEGLTTVSAVQESVGDYEPMGVLTEVTSRYVQLHAMAERPQPALGAAQPKKNKIECTVQIDRADLASSHSARDYICKAAVEHYPGTHIGVSIEMLQQLRAGQSTEYNFSAETSPFAALLPSKGPPISTHAGVPMYSCMLHRVGTADVAFPVIVNGQPVILPALHAMCAFAGGEETHVYYLDQPDNPLTLAQQDGVRDVTNQVIKITFPERQASAGASQIEKALAERKPVDVYGIYFDFNSIVIKPESEPVLKQIAAILQKNPDWKLSVAGHTDDIGGNPANLALSQRRSAAVKEALVTRYQIAPERLETAGYGASRPIETNSTMEGRARNRRVELQRQ